MQRAYLEGKVSVVDEHVDSAKLLTSRANHRIHLRPLGHVGLKNHAARASAFDFVQYFLRCFFVLEIIDDDGGAALRQADNSRRADAAARTGNQGDLIYQRSRSGLGCHV